MSPPGGSTLTAFPQTLSPAALITLRLVSVKDGQTQNAFVCNSPVGCPQDALASQLHPGEVPFQADHSAEWALPVHSPAGFFGRRYRLPAPRHRGAFFPEGSAWEISPCSVLLLGVFDTSFSFRTEAAPGPLPLQVGANTTSALEWTRLAAPLPPMLPSLNQIGFDYMDWILGTACELPRRMEMARAR